MCELVSDTAQTQRRKFCAAQKIKKKSEISGVLKSGQYWGCRFFVLVYAENGADKSRFGVLVSRKHGNAVLRNRIKRVFREVYRCNIRNAPPFFDILIKPRLGMCAKTLRFFEIAEMFNTWQDEICASRGATLCGERCEN